MTREQRAELRRLAEAATDWADGEWEWDHRRDYVCAKSVGGPIAFDVCEECGPFIAAANPAAVIALLDALDEAECELSRRDEADADARWERSLRDC